MSVTAAYLKLTTGEKGVIQGTARQKGREGFIKVLAVNHDILSPRDLATGAAIGKRQHQPIFITKEVDNTTPQLYELMVRNAAIREVEILFYGNDPTGIFRDSETNFYSIKLRDVFISRIDLALYNLLEDQQRIANLVEKVSLVYGHIEWKWTNGEISATDYWHTSA